VQNAVERRYGGSGPLAADSLNHGVEQPDLADEHLARSAQRPPMQDESAPGPRIQSSPRVVWTAQPRHCPEQMDVQGAGIEHEHTEGGEKRNACKTPTYPDGSLRVGRRLRHVVIPTHANEFACPDGQSDLPRSEALGEKVGSCEHRARSPNIHP